MSVKVTMSGTAYMAACSDIEPIAVTPVFSGSRITIEVADEDAREALISRMFGAACDAADDGHLDISEAIYKAIEQSDRAAGMKENAK